MLILCFNMGQHMSMTRKNKRKAHKLFNSQFFINRNNNTLSHTFAVFDDEPVVDLINVNSASENDLLKVREIDLDLSKNIIKHRRTIGYYQKVEDLVVVPGMGAERLDQIKHQVCTSSKPAMRSSSQSFDSLRSADSRTTIPKSNKLVNINKASIFELQLVHGITQEIAAGIVYYRNKKGPFKRVEDLRKIKCIDYIRLDNISRNLTVHDEDDLISENRSENPRITSNGCIKANGGPVRYSSVNGVTHGMPAAIMADIFELLSVYSPRPIIEDVFKYSRNDQPAFRVASWNLNGFSVEKASNLGVKEVICRTVLENGWSILAIQSVESKDALKLICEELNNPKLHRVEEWSNNSRHWKYESLESAIGHLGFIYDATGVDDTKITSSGKGPPEMNTFCESMVTSFEIGNTAVQIMNINVDSGSSLPEIHDCLQKFLSSDSNCLICGEYGVFSSHIDICPIENSKILLPTNILNHLHSGPNFPKLCTCNFLLNTSLQKHLTGLYGVLRHGLTHLAIPSGWSWGGAVSIHCPIWAEFFVNSELNL